MVALTRAMIDPPTRMYKLLLLPKRSQLMYSMEAQSAVEVEVESARMHKCSALKWQQWWLQRVLKQFCWVKITFKHQLSNQWSVNWKVTSRKHAFHNPQVQTTGVVEGQLTAHSYCRTTEIVGPSKNYFFCCCALLKLLEHRTNASYNYSKK